MRNDIRNLEIEKKQFQAKINTIRKTIEKVNEKKRKSCVYRIYNFLVFMASAAAFLMIPSSFSCLYIGIGLLVAGGVGVGLTGHLNNKYDSLIKNHYSEIEKIEESIKELNSKIYGNEIVGTISENNKNETTYAQYIPTKFDRSNAKPSTNELSK